MDKANEDIILACLVKRKDFMQQAYPYIKAEYFPRQSQRILFQAISEYIEKYQDIPGTDPVSIAIQKKNLTEGIFDECLETLQRVEAAKTSSYKIDWLIQECENWVEQRSVYNAVMKCIEVIDGKDKDHTVQAFPDIMRDSLSVGFDRDIGHSYLDLFDARYDEYTTKASKIPFDIDVLNEVTGGGVELKTLNVVMAATGVGKSMFLCHLAAAYMSQGYDVLYVTCEMAEHKIAQRIDANLMDTPIGSIEKLPKSVYLTKAKEVQRRCLGKLVIKEYPTATANANHFRHLLNELKLKKNFKPKIVMVDYLNICASARYRASAAVNSYTMVKSIAEELRGLAIEQNICVWSATQTNREGIGASDISMTETSESIGLPQTCDFFAGLVRTEELDQMDQVMMKQLKNRYNDLALMIRFMLGVDRSKMKFFDAGPAAQRGLTPSARPPQTASHGLPAGKGGQGSSYGGLKV